MIEIQNLTLCFPAQERITVWTGSDSALIWARPVWEPAAIWAVLRLTAGCPPPLNPPTPLAWRPGGSCQMRKAERLKVTFQWQHEFHCIHLSETLFCKSDQLSIETHKHCSKHSTVRHGLCCTQAYYMLLSTLEIKQYKTLPFISLHYITLHVKAAKWCDAQLH